MRRYAYGACFFYFVPIEWGCVSVRLWSQSSYQLQTLNGYEELYQRVELTVEDFVAAADRLSSGDMPMERVSSISILVGRRAAIRDPVRTRFRLASTHTTIELS